MGGVGAQGAQVEDVPLSGNNLLPRRDLGGITGVGVLPVRLEPGKTYAIWVNSEKFGNFKDADGRSAVPYLPVFRTKK